MYNNNYSHAYNHKIITNQYTFSPRIVGSICKSGLELLSEIESLVEPLTSYSTFSVTSSFRSKILCADIN